MKAINLALLTALTGLTCIGSAAADKTCYSVSAMRYQNNGAYTVEKFYIMYKDENGEKQSKRGIKDSIYSGETRIVYLTDDFNLPHGAEVWGKVSIESGETEGCRKDGTKFYYHKTGGTVSYKTGGSTYNNNRCELKNRPSDEHLIDCP